MITNEPNNFTYTDDATGLSITVSPATTAHPISKMGQIAGVCWGADSKEPYEKTYKRGLECVMSGHGRVFECVNVEIVIENMSARAMRELYTHIAGGPTRLQESTRYVKYDKPSFFVPERFKDYEPYHDFMKQAFDNYAQLISKCFPKEDAANVLPLGMMSKMYLKTNLRMLENLMNQRLCSRAYKEMQTFANTLKNALVAYEDTFAGYGEWKEIADNIFVPKCVKLLYCPEKKCCGRAASYNREWKKNT